MKFLEVFVIVSLLFFGAAGWWYAGGFVPDLSEISLSGLNRMTEEVIQGLMSSAQDVAGRF